MGDFVSHMGLYVLSVDSLMSWFSSITVKNVVPATLSLSQESASENWDWKNYNVVQIVLHKLIDHLLYTHKHVNMINIISYS